MTDQIAPVQITVHLVGATAETRLMSAMDELILRMSKMPDPSDSLQGNQCQRAVDWLQSKYGSRK